MRYIIPCLSNEEQETVMIYKKDDENKLHHVLHLNSRGMVTLNLDQLFDKFPLCIGRGDFATNISGSPDVITVMERKSVETADDEIDEMHISFKDMVKIDSLPHELKDKVKRWADKIKKRRK